MSTKKVKTAVYFTAETLERLNKRLEHEGDGESRTEYIEQLVVADLDSLDEYDERHPEPAEPTPKRALPQPAPAERIPDPVAQTQQAVAQLERPLGDFSKGYQARRAK